MTDAICETCLKKGPLGDFIRTYKVTSPLAVSYIYLCWPCAEKKMKKNRPHYYVRDKVTT